MIPRPAHSWSAERAGELPGGLTGRVAAKAGMARASVCGCGMLERELVGRKRGAREEGAVKESRD